MAGPPSGVRVFVRPSRYEVGRAHITVINELQGAAMVDLGQSGLRVGQSFEIRDVQNFWGAPVVTGTYDDSAVRVPLNLTAVTPIVGAGQAVNAAMKPPVHLAKEFNSFVLLPH